MKYFLLGLLFALFIIPSAKSQTKLRVSRPEKDFKKLWNTFNDNYAFFELKQVNWDSIYAKYRPEVNRKTSQKQLIEIFKEMVAPLKDGHITISRKDNVIFKVAKESHFKTEFAGIENEFWQNTYLALDSFGFKTIQKVGPVFRNESLYTVSETSDFGYIRISRFFGNLESLFDDKSELEDTQLMLSLFDSLLNSYSTKKALIIDLRANGGGHGGVELASRFTNEKKLTHFKSTRLKGGHDNFTKEEPQYLIPNNGQQFLKPIVILTNDKTASSAEDFTVSLYQQKGVTTIGTNTSGMMSDMFSGELSKKISFTLSNERYYSTKHQLLEDVGVPAEIKVQNSKSDLQNHSDPVITAAIKFLSQQVLSAQ
ncbi:MAG: S41 family peptidase [Daejeonella sp.]